MSSSLSTDLDERADRPESGAADAARAAAAAAAATPCLRLYTERLTVNVGDSFDPQEEDKVLPVLALAFDYQGRLVRASDRREIIGDSVRDSAGESRARQILESFGPLDLACLDDVTAKLGSQADYVVRTDADTHALCSFTAYAVPQLRALGWRIDVAADYPWQTVDQDPPLFAEILRRPAGRDSVGGENNRENNNDWFSLHLGIEVEGRRINLLPVLLDLLERMSPTTRLEALTPPGARGFALPTGDGRFVTIPTQRMQVLLRVISELHGKAGPDKPERGKKAGKANREELRFPGIAAHALAEMEAALDPRADGRPPVSWSGATAVKDRGRALHAGAPPDEITPPPGLRADLRPYQRQGLAWLQHLRAQDAGAVLADDMGLGKTLQAIAHVVAEKDAGRLRDPAVVVTLTSLVGNWRREIARFAPYLKVLVMHGPGRHKLWARMAHADVIVTTYPAMVRDADRWEGRAIHLALLDEAQAIKNPRSQAHEAIMRLCARHRVCLSGTPVENSLSELWSLFEFVNPGLLGEAEWFAQRYTRPIEREGRTERLVELRGQVAPFILRRMKEEVATELPPKTEIVRPVELKGPQRDLYEGLRLAGHAEVRKAIADKGLGASTITILDALMKLRQVCCDPRLLPAEVARSLTDSAKYDLLIELVQQQRAAGRRMLVFSQFASMLALIAHGLRDAEVPFVVLTGATQNRDKPIDDFQSGRADVFLISLKAGGTGLNLTTADTVIHYDPWWNPAVQAQATDRAYRIGQKKPVFVYNLIVAGSVEERMLALQRRKRALAEGLLGRASEGEFQLSPAEIDTLFAPIEDPAADVALDAAVEADDDAAPPGPQSEGAARGAPADKAAETGPEGTSD
jgi:superfamily II DNA or RNA helicase